MREALIEKKVCDAFEKAGWLVRKVGYIARRGSPDRWFMKGGFLVCIEFKQKGKKPTPQQNLEHQRLTEAGIPVYVIDNIPAGLLLLNEVEARYFSDRTFNYL